MKLHYSFFPPFQEVCYYSSPKKEIVIITFDSRKINYLFFEIILATTKSEWPRFKSPW